RANSKGLGFFKLALLKFPKTIELDIQNINLLIFLNIQTKNYREALYQIQYIRTHKLKPTLRTYDLLLNACRLAGNFITAKKLIREMREREMMANAMILSSILTCTVKLPKLEITDLCCVLEQIEEFKLDMSSLKNESYKFPFKINSLFLRSMFNAYSLALDMADEQLLDEKLETWTFFKDFYKKKLDSIKDHEKEEEIESEFNTESSKISSNRDNFLNFEKVPPKTLKTSSKQSNLMSDDEKLSRKSKDYQNDSASNNETSELSSTGHADYLMTGERNVKLVRKRYRSKTFDAEFNDEEKSQHDSTDFKSREENYEDRSYRDDDSNDAEDGFARKSKAEKPLKHQENDGFRAESDIKGRAKPKYDEREGSKADATSREGSWSNSTFERQEKPRYRDGDDDYSRFVTRNGPSHTERNQTTRFNIKPTEQRPRYHEQEQEFSRPRFREIEDNKGKYRQNYGAEENKYDKDYQSQPKSWDRKISGRGSLRDTPLRQSSLRFSERNYSRRFGYNEQPQRSSFRHN
ncbi:6575_t:CDS:2, partial [Ambispora leptoticha]